jgi:hypothetical protein
MAVVYVIQKQMRWDPSRGEHVPRFDLEPAKKYGELRYLLSPTANPFNPGPIIDDMANVLAHFTADDYLLLIGNPCLIGWAVAIASFELLDRDGKLKLLQWHGRDKKYIVVEADVLGAVE